MTEKPQHLLAQPLTSEAFAPFGDVIEASDDSDKRMNDGRFTRYDQLAAIDITAPAQAAISIVSSIECCSLPYQFDLVERHPLGSQAFIPLSEFIFVVAVAAPGDAPTGIQAFVSNGKQGINYHRGTWHMPLIALAEGHAFLVVDRAGAAPGNNCETFRLHEPLILDALT